MKNFISMILYQPLYNALIFLVLIVPDHNVGWAIIILTTIVRLILLPSSLSATRAQKKMRDLQPELNKLQETYKGDKQKLAQAQMDFYKENKVNPLGSCLPLLIQLPILIVMYYVFRAGLTTDNFNLLYQFVHHPPYIKTVFLGINLANPDRYILPVIAGILQFIQSKQLMPQTPPPSSDPKKGPDMQSMMNKQMMYLMPIFTIFIAGRLPAALPLYWVVTNLFTIAQQWYVFREKTPEKVLNQERAELKEIISSDEKLKDVKKITAPIKTFKKHGVEVTIRRKGEK